MFAIKGTSEKIKNDSMYKCVVPENIHTLPKNGHWKFLEEAGLKSQNFKGKV